jgi:hypothetical protein
MTDGESVSCATWQIPSRSKYCCFLKRWSVSPPGNSEAATGSAVQVQIQYVREKEEWRIRINAQQECYSVIR